MIEELALRDSEVRLRDGRTLAYAEYGEADGYPVLFFHGTPGARLLHPRALRAGAAHSRIIAVDRPGYGRSDFHSGWGMLDWADDVATLADALGLARFAVVGFSGGGPYAAACAYRWPARVSALGLACAVVPLPIDRAGADRPAASAALDARTVLARTGSWPEFRANFIEVNGATPPDRAAIFADPGLVSLPPEYQEFIRRGFPEAFRQGWDGRAYDSWLLRRPWGFQLEEIAVRAYLWQGEDDEVVPLRDGQYLAQAIPGCRAVYFPAEGHLFASHHWDEILTTLVGDPNAC